VPQLYFAEQLGRVHNAIHAIVDVVLSLLQDDLTGAPEPVLLDTAGKTLIVQLCARDGQAAHGDRHDGSVGIRRVRFANRQHKPPLERTKRHPMRELAL